MDQCFGRFLHSRRLSYTAIALRFACCLAQLRSQVPVAYYLLLVSNGLVTTALGRDPQKKWDCISTSNHLLFYHMCYFPSLFTQLRGQCNLLSVSLNPHNGNVINPHSQYRGWLIEHCTVKMAYQKYFQHTPFPHLVCV